VKETKPVFTWINSQGVRSDRGFEVESMGRFTIEYREGDRKVSVEVEGSFFGGKAHISILPTAFERWDDDPDWATIPTEKQDKMLANFTEAMEFQEVTVAIEPAE
jgi:hypothetical protein